MKGCVDICRNLESILETMGNTGVSVQDGPDQIFMSSRSCKSLEGKRAQLSSAQLSEYLQHQRNWRFSFQNPSRGSLLLSYITRHEEPPAGGNEMPHCWSGSVLRKLIIKAIYPRCWALEGRCGDLNQRAVSGPNSGCFSVLQVGLSIPAVTG